jgi:hypothetical protein
MEVAQKQARRPMDQYIRSRHKPMHFSQLVFDKGAQNPQWRKYSVFQQIVLGKLDIHV